MKTNKKFLEFVNALKTKNNKALIETIVKGYEKCFEGIPRMSSYQPSQAVLPFIKQGLPQKEFITIKKTDLGEYRVVMYDENNQIVRRTRAYKNPEIAEWEAKIWAENENVELALP